MAYAKVVNGLNKFWNRRKFLDKNWFQLKSRQTFIFPTGFGFAFGAIAIVLLVMAIGYANNLLYFFVFLLISIAFVGMLITNKNVDAVFLKSVQNLFLYAEEARKIKLILGNKKTVTNVWDIKIEVSLSQENKEIFTFSKAEVLALENESTAVFDIIAHRRGQFNWPRFLIQSDFPFKMLRAWKYEFSSDSFYVFPKLKGKSLFAISDEEAGEENQLHRSINGIFKDLQDFQITDSPRRIDWRQSTKHQKLLVKNYESDAEIEKKLIDYDQTKHLKNFEDRMSQLAFWIDECYKKNLNYSLKFPLHLQSYQTAYLSGETHYIQCMQFLAKVQQNEVKDD